MVDISPEKRLPGLSSLPGLGDDKRNKRSSRVTGNDLSDPKELEKRLIEARLETAQAQPDLLRAQAEGLREAGGGFGQALGLEESFLGLAEDLLDPAEQEKRFASVREQLLGTRARQGLFGATGDESVSIQGLSALDSLRRQDISFARDLTSSSFFNAPSSVGRQGEGLLGPASSNSQFRANLAFQRRIARDTGEASQGAGIGALLGAGVGAFYGGAPGAAVGSQAGGLAGATFA